MAMPLHDFGLSNQIDIQWQCQKTAELAWRPMFDQRMLTGFASCQHMARFADLPSVADDNKYLLQSDA